MTDIDFSDLQVRQLHHDRHYHSDIDNLPLKAKLTHYVLHLAKYNGRLIEGGNPRPTLVDGCIIMMGMANALGIELDGQKSELHKEAHKELFAMHATVLTGRLANAIEKLDHLEDYDYRPSLIKNVKELGAWIADEAKYFELDLPLAIEKRWEGMEEKSIIPRPRTELKYLHNTL